MIHHMYPLIAASHHFLSLGTKKSFADMSEYFTLTVSGLCENLSELTSFSDKSAAE